MKYSRLTREQFEALHQEFAEFLATQSIDQYQWEIIKREKPQLFEEELDLFSDMIWDQTLRTLTHLENSSPTQLFLFACARDTIRLRLVKCNQPDVDLTTSEGWEWVLSHIHSSQVELFTSEKKITKDREQQLFALIQQGCQMSRGERFEQLESFFKNPKK